MRDRPVTRNLLTQNNTAQKKLVHISVFGKRSEFVDFLQGSDAAWTFMWVPTFRRNILSPSSALKMEVPAYKFTRCYNLQDQYRYILRRENLKSRVGSKFKFVLKLQAWELIIFCFKTQGSYPTVSTGQKTGCDPDRSGSSREEKNRVSVLEIEPQSSNCISRSKEFYYHANVSYNLQESGVVLRGFKRFQMNMFLTRMTSLDALNNVSEGLFPVFWIDEVS
jgi:hypothetical protein